MHKSHHLLGLEFTLHLSFLSSYLHFSNLISQKSDKNKSIKIIFIKVVIKINIINYILRIPISLQENTTLPESSLK